MPDDKNETMGSDPVVSFFSESTVKGSHFEPIVPKMNKAKN